MCHPTFTKRNNALLKDNAIFSGRVGFVGFIPARSPWLFSRFHSVRSMLPAARWSSPKRAIIGWLEPNPSGENDLLPGTLTRPARWGSTCGHMDCILMILCGSPNFCACIIYRICVLINQRYRYSKKSWVFPLDIQNHPNTWWEGIWNPQKPSQEMFRGSNISSKGVWMSRVL